MPCKEYLELAERTKDCPFIEYYCHGKKNKIIFMGEKDLGNIIIEDIAPRVLNEVLLKYGI